MEARRYRYYEVWPIVFACWRRAILPRCCRNGPCRRTRNVAEHISSWADLITPHFTISEWEAAAAAEGKLSLDLYAACVVVGIEDLYPPIAYPTLTPQDRERLLGAALFCPCRGRAGAGLDGGAVGAVFNSGYLLWRSDIEIEGFVKRSAAA